MRAEDVDEEDQDPECHHERSNGGDEVVDLPASAVRVRVHAPRHSLQPEQVLREECQVHPDQHQPERELAEPLAELAPEHLRPPVVQPGEDAEDRAPEEHVMQVSDDEVGVGHLPVDGERGEEDPGQAADREHTDESQSEQHRRIEDQVPAPRRREPVEDLHPCRNRNRHRAEHEERLQPDRHPDGEHVVCPNEHREEADADCRERDRLVAEDRLARKDGDDLRDDPHRRQDHDVDLWVAEEPEDVLPENGAAALRRIEEVRAGLPVDQQQRQAHRERRQHEDQHQGVDLDRPREERQAHPRHSGSSQVVQRDDEVDRTGERRDREDVQREDPEVDAVTARVLARRQRGVTRPAALRRAAAGEEAEQEREPSEEEQPVGHRVQARERHVVGADHQREQVVPEAREDRDDDEKDHRRSVNREELVVAVARDEVLVRRRELRTHEQRHDPAGHEEEQRRGDVEDPDPLVVGRRQPAGDASFVPGGTSGKRLGASRHSSCLRSAPSGTRPHHSSACRPTWRRPPASSRTHSEGVVATLSGH